MKKLSIALGILIMTGVAVAGSIYGTVYRYDTEEPVPYPWIRIQKIPGIEADSILGTSQGEYWHIVNNGHYHLKAWAIIEGIEWWDTAEVDVNNNSVRQDFYISPYGSDPPKK